MRGGGERAAGLIAQAEQSAKGGAAHGRVARPVGCRGLGSRPRAGPAAEARPDVDSERDASRLLPISDKLPGPRVHWRPHAPRLLIKICSIFKLLPVASPATRLHSTPPAPQASIMAKLVGDAAKIYEASSKLAKYPFEPYWPEKKLKICITGAGGFIAR